MDPHELIAMHSGSACTASLSPNSNEENYCAAKGTCKGTEKIYLLISARTSLDDRDHLEERRRGLAPTLNSKSEDSLTCLECCLYKSKSIYYQVAVLSALSSKEHNATNSSHPVV